MEQAVGLAAAAQVHPQRGVPVPGEVGVPRPVARRRAVALAVGDVLEDRRAPGSASASSGSQMRAPSRVPSDSGIQTWSIMRTGRGRSVTTLIGASALRAARRRARRGRGPDGRARAAAPSTLKGLPSSRTGPTPALLDRLDEAVRAHLLVVEELRRALRTSLAGTRRAASPATASCDAQPREARLDGGHVQRPGRSRSARVRGLGLRVRRRAGRSSPSSSQTPAPLVGVEARQRHEAVRARVRAVVGVERLHVALDRWRASRARQSARGSSRALDRHEALRLQRERGAEQRHLELGRPLAPAEQPRGHRQRGQQPGGEVGERQARRCAAAPRRRVAGRPAAAPRAPARSGRTPAARRRARCSRRHETQTDTQRGFTAADARRGRARSGAHARAGSCARARRRCDQLAAARAPPRSRRSSATERLPRLSA